MGYDHAVYDHLTHHPTAADSAAPDDINNYYYGMFEQPAEASHHAYTGGVGYFLNNDESEQLLALYGARELFGQLAEMEPRKPRKKRERKARREPRKED